MMTADASNFLPQSSCESVTRPTQARRHQVCDHCGGRFGLVTHRWWGNKFCKQSCKAMYLREVRLNRDAILRWFGLTRPKHGITPASALCVR
jgi:hypothetical protein